LRLSDSGGAFMARAEEYRRYAAECVRVAQDTADPKDKALLLEMAQRWLELAERAQRLDK
jgi:hypothetical protein